MANNTSQTNFNAGELSPLLDVRSNLEKYANACSTMKNCYAIPHGALTRRPGFKYVADALNSDKRSRLIPFEFSTEQAYILEFSEQEIQFFKDQGVIRELDSDTHLMIHADGEEASKTITDSSQSAHSISVVGDAQITQLVKKFGGTTNSGSLVFGGGTSYVSVATSTDFDFGAGKLTIDFWVRLTSLDSNTFCSRTQDASNYLNFYINPSDKNIWFQHYDGVTFVNWQTASNSFVPELDTWYHISVIRGWGGVADDWAITVDGVAIATETRSTAVPTLSASFDIGSTGGTQVFHGYIDEFRISKGVARWTTDFTPDTLPYPSMTGGVDYSVTSNVPYLESELPQISYTQSADVLFLAHPEHSPKKLARTGDTSWTMTDVDFTDGPYEDENTSATTFTPSATTGTITITASVATFASTDVGRLVSIKHGTTWGVAEITVFTSTTLVTAVVSRTFGGTGAVSTWKMGAFSETTGYPAKVIFHENRLCYAKTTTHPDRVWFSKIGVYEDFGQGVDSSGVEQAIVDDDGLDTDIVSNQINAIQWMYSGRNLFVGTSGAEWQIEGDVSAGITPSAIRTSQQTNNGSESLRPVGINESIIYLQRVGKKPINFAYLFEADSYVSDDLILLAEHLTRKTTITAWAYQQEPNSILWVVRSDGDLLGLTYNKKHGVTAWHQHDTQGTFESIATIPGSERDEVWVVVKRTVNGSTVRYIELLETELTNKDSVEDAFYVDSGLTYEGPSTAAISGLDHLEGEDVIILSEGSVVTGKTVASGSITLDKETTKCHVGLSYDTDLKTLPVITVQNMANTKRVSRSTLRLYQTITGFLIGRDSSNLEKKTFNSYTGNLEHHLDDGHELEPQIFIRRDDAGPLTIMSITNESQSYER